MKRNHLHSFNPHMKKTLPERIAEYYVKNPTAHLRNVAEELKISEWQLLDAMPSAISIPISDFAEIYEELRLLEKVMLHLDTGAVLLHLTMKLPKATDQNEIKIINHTAVEMSVTSLIFSDTLYAVFLVREQFEGSRESLSVALVGEDEKIALSIYLCRSDQNTIEEKSKSCFEALWNKYKE